MTRLKLGLLVLVLVVGGGALVVQHHREAGLRAEIRSLRQRLEQLQEANESLSKRLPLGRAVRTLRLPAPPFQVAALTNELPSEGGAVTNLYVRFKERAPKLSATQLAAYLNANGRSAASLLAAYRTSKDPALLQEAMEKYPRNPQVAFEAAMGQEVSPEQRRAWLNALQQAAPDNALPDYLLARDYLKAGQMEQALQELTLAYTKPQFQDYTLERVQDDQEAYLAAGYSAAEAERIALSWLELPQLAQVKDLGNELVALAKAYRQAGDADSAQAALQMAMNLGQRYGDGPANAALISQLVGWAVERMALNAMDSTSPYGGSGRTVQERLDQLMQQSADVRGLAQQAEPLLLTLSDQEIMNYQNRRLLFGELAALRWVVGKYGH